MGKYIRKSKTTGEIAVMEVSQPQSSLGVCTRARTLALQSAAANTSGSGNANASESYLQLRSRRLLKPPIHAVSKRQKSNPRASGSVRKKGAQDDKEAEKLGDRERTSAEKKKDGGDHDDKNKKSENFDLGIDTSFGENVLDFESKERSTRESTPCSLIRDPDAIKTSSSTSKPARSADTSRRILTPAHPQVPPAHEIDEFLAGFEREQQIKFMEKYNFDPVNEKPLPGRYRWERIDP